MESVNAHLLGKVEARSHLNTPALVLDLDSFEANLKKMAEFAERNGVSLRPHAKTHKCSEISRRQIAAGAIGQCCAKLGEAEVLIQQGIEGVLLTSPIVTTEGIKRLVKLSQGASAAMVVVDNQFNVSDLQSAAQAENITLDVLVDLDVGLHRTGVTTIETGIRLAKQIEASGSLRFRGFQAYAGHAMHIEGEHDRRGELEKVAAKVREFRDELVSAGLAPEIVTGAGTGSYDIDPGFHVFTELQVGSYVFMDREYSDIWELGGEHVPFKPSLFVQTTVISANHPNHCTTDAGCKAFATEAGLPRIVSGAPDGAQYSFFGDEHGRVSYSDHGAGLMPGDTLACVTPHCDPTVNLYDHYHVVRGSGLVDVWKIDARGRSQ